MQTHQGIGSKAAVDQSVPLRPRVFVSSVIEGFEAHREATRTAIEATGGDPVLVNEDFPSMHISSRIAKLRVDNRRLGRHGSPLTGGPHAQSGGRSMFLPPSLTTPLTGSTRVSANSEATVRKRMTAATM